MPGTRLVEASAGTGKTWRITQTVLRLVVEDGVPIERMLVVTFTEAATAELRTRVRRRLREAWEAVVRVRAEPGWRPPNDPELAVLISGLPDPAATEDALRGALERFDLATISTIHGFCARMLQRFALESGTPFDLALVGDARGFAREAVLDYWARETHSLQTSELQALQKHFCKYGKEPLSELFDLAAKTVDDPDAQIVPAPVAGALAGASPIDLSCGLAARVAAEVPRRLSQARALTYQQLLARLRTALAHEAAGAALRDAVRQAYAVALIDEFQDTDPVQWEIFRDLFHDHAPLWLIGDPKQAIYAFRGADVRTYLDAANAPGVTHEPPLQDNHRSDADLVAAVNHLFTAARAPFVDPQIIAEAVQAVHGARRLVGDDGPPLVVRWLPTSCGVTNAGGLLKRNWTEDAVAALCARDLAETLAAPLRITHPAERGIRPRDCAVLVRTNDQGRAIQAALRGHSVPTVLRTEASVFDADEVGHLGVVLSAILDPSDASAVSRALLTPILGRRVADLAEMASDDGRWTDEVARFRRWSALWTEHGFARAFHDLLADSRTIERFLVWPDGQRRVGDLLHLGELLHGETARGRGPRSLLQWLADGGPGVDPEASHARLEADDDAVTIVTIHKAKGLEWPLVWCPYLWTSASVFPDEKRNLRVRLDDGTREIDLRAVDDAEKADRIKLAEREVFAEVMRVAYVALTRARHRCTVYWGQIEFAERSPLAWLFHQDADAHDHALLAATRARFLNVWDTELRADLAQLAADSGGVVGISDVGTIDRTPVDWRGDLDPGALAAREIVRRAPLDLLWRRSSFSAMTRDSWTPDAGRPDTRDTDPDGLGDPAPREEAQIPLHDVPSFGPKMGDVVHESLEAVDFARPDTLADIVAARCIDNGVDVAWAPRVAEALAGALLTPLDGADPTFTLAAIPARDRKSELEFHLPVAGGFAPTGRSVVAAAIADALDAHPSTEVPAYYADLVRRLPFAPLHGFMTGSIDLVVRRGGRVYVADYKSNRVGETFASYGPDALSDAMTEHHYVLQGLLYAVAVHRWSRARDATYRYDTHFGGVLYLFVRGMTPATGAARGVWSWRPPLGLIDAIDGVLRGES